MIAMNKRTMNNINRNISCLICGCLLVIALLSAFMPSVSYAAFDFVTNSDFQQGLLHWVVSTDNKDATILFANGEVRFQGMLGSVRHSIMQQLEFDASDYSSLLLTASIKVDAANLAGTGLNGNEAPLAVFVQYTDENGIEHIAYGLNGRFWRGFYYEDPTPPVASINGQKVAQGVWQEIQFDILAITPRPKWIHTIGAEGAGWARRSAAIKQLALIAPEEGREFVVNPMLRQMAAGWQPCLDFSEVAYQSELVPLKEGMQIKSVIGNKRVGLLQKVEADISRFQSLILSAEVKVDRQQLSGTGYDGREAPLALFVTYTDIDGVKHDRLPIKAEDAANRMFWRGLYIVEPQPPATGAHGLLLDPERWRTVSFELMELEPKPKVIHILGVEGSGRAPHEADVRKISLKGR